MNFKVTMTFISTAIAFATTNAYATCPNKAPRVVAAAEAIEALNGNSNVQTETPKPVAGKYGTYTVVTYNPYRTTYRVVVQDDDHCRVMKIEFAGAQE
jgi:hypothetical protein